MSEDQQPQPVLENYFYSASTGGFYLASMHAEIPEDKVEITPAFHAELLQAQSNGAVIVPDNNGYPFPSIPPVPAFNAPAYLANYRYEKEVGGITIGGAAISTAREEKANYIGARIKAKESADYSVDYKTPSGFVTLSSAQIIAIADAVEAHVQKCFTAEKTVLESIDDLETPEEVAAAFDAAMAS